MHRWLFAALLLAAPPATAAPRIVDFACRIGQGRGLSLAPADEDDSDDELACHGAVSALGGRSAGDLVAELRLVPARGPFRVVASAPLASDGALARTGDLFVSHSTWASAIDCRGGAPRLW